VLSVVLGVGLVLEDDGHADDVCHYFTPKERTMMRAMR
jgi:hypothetical protein